MALVTELELPEFDHLDPTLRGDRFHERMRQQRNETGLDALPLAFEAAG
jgi:hypothetical protein